MNPMTYTNKVIIRVSDLNYGQHLGYAQLVSLLHQTRVQFLHQYALNEFNIENTQLLIKELEVSYTNEAFLLDELKFSLSFSQKKKTTMTLQYDIFNTTRNNNTAKATETCLFISNKTKKITRTPKFWQQFLSEPIPVTEIK